MKNKYVLQPWFVKSALLAGPILFSSLLVQAQQKIEPWQQAQITEVWQPVPKKVAVGSDGIPSDATVLFDGSTLKHWQSADGSDAKWKVKDGAFSVNSGSGDLQTRSSFCDVQLHVEWRIPAEPSKEGQGKGNSGIFLQGRYEVQVLDSFENKTYSNGQASSIYKQHIPLANASFPPEQWQKYDIIFYAPKFNSDKKLLSKGHVTVLHNGVIVQHNVQIQGQTEWIGAPKYHAHGCSPLKLQDHGNKVSYRNIWIRKLD